MNGKYTIRTAKLFVKRHYKYFWNHKDADTFAAIFSGHTLQKGRCLASLAVYLS